MSQLLAFEQQKLTSLGLQSGYVRLFPSRGVVQQRGTYSPFSGPIKQLHYRLGQITTEQSLLWGEQNIFSNEDFALDEIYKRLDMDASGEACPLKRQPIPAII